MPSTSRRASNALNTSQKHISSSQPEPFASAALKRKLRTASQPNTSTQPVKKRRNASTVNADTSQPRRTQVPVDISSTSSTTPVNDNEGFEPDDDNDDLFDSENGIDSDKNITDGHAVDSFDRQMNDIEEEELFDTAVVVPTRKSHKPKPRKRGSDEDIPILPTARVLDDSEVQKYHELQVVCRVAYLQHFTLLPHEKIIRKVWGNIDRSNFHWAQAKTRLNNYNGNWKRRPILSMARKIKQYRAHDPKFDECEDRIELTRMFGNLYSPSSFLYVFEFLNGCIDVAETDARSRKWHFYFKSIYCAFGAKVKLYLDWDSSPRKEFDDERCRTNLLTWYTTMSKSEKYKDLPVSELVYMDSKDPTERARQQGILLPDDDLEYICVGTPPNSPRRGGTQHSSHTSPSTSKRTPAHKVSQQRTPASKTGSQQIPTTKTGSQKTPRIPAASQQEEVEEVEETPSKPAKR